MPSFDAFHDVSTDANALDVDVLRQQNKELQAKLDNAKVELEHLKDTFAETQRLLTKENDLLRKQLSAFKKDTASRGPAEQQAQRLENAHRAATELQCENVELSDKKRPLGHHNDEMIEEIQRGRRRRTETPNGGDNGPRSNLERIKIWTGTEEKKFADLHPSVQ